MTESVRTYATRGGLLAAMLLIVSTVAMVPAQEGGIAQYGREDRQEGDTRITLRVKDQPLEDVLKYIREQSGINIILGEDIKEKVTVDLDRVPWRLALELVAEKAGCVLVQKATNLIRVEQPPRVTFDFRGADIKTVIDSIAKIAGTSVVIAPQVEGKVHLRLNDVPWLMALHTVAKSLGYVVVEEEWGIYRIVSPDMLEKQMVTRVFPIKYLRPPPRYRARIATEYADDLRGRVITAGAGGDPSTIVEKSFTLIKALRGTLSENGTLNYHPRENIIVVKDIPPVIDEIEKILNEIDVEPSQVFIDVKFVTTSNTDALSYGIDVGDDGLLVSLSGGAIPSRLPFNLGGGGWNNEIIANEQKRTPGLTGDDLIDRIVYGTLDFTSTTLTLQLLKQDITSRIVQAPKLMCLDNQEATIFVGTTIRFAETSAESAQSGGLQFSIKEAANSPVQTGFQLFMVPHIVPGTNKIMMTVIPEAEQLTGSSTTLPGFVTFTSGEGPGAVSIDLPEVSSQTLVSTLMLESGETAVIGGLITERENTKVNKVPFLGDLPVLGWFFKSEKRTKVTQSLFIFITPRIIRDTETYNAILMEMDRKRMDAIEREMEAIFGDEEGGSGGQDGGSQGDSGEGSGSGAGSQR